MEAAIEVNATDIQATRSAHLEEELRSLVCFERVPSGSNPADGPSRDHLREWFSATRLDPILGGISGI